MKYLKSENTWSLTPDMRLDVRDSLPVGNYTVCQNPVSKEYYLEESERFALPSKLYGKTSLHGERILETFENRQADSQTGVFLSGTKGSGKTLLAKYIANVSELPVIIVNTPYCDDRFMRTIQGIEQPAVILFDEFEKLYDKEAQESILTLFDGVYTARNKIMIITCNDKHSVRDFFHNRPSRLRYAIEFEGLGASFVEEYCNDLLIDKSYIEQIIKLSASCEEFNFDMLQTLVDELNRYGGDFEDVIEILNVKPLGGGGKSKWTVLVETRNEKGSKWKVTSGGEISVSPMLMISSDRWGRNIQIDVTLQSAKKAGAEDEDEEDDNYVTLWISSEHLYKVDPYAGTYVFKINEDGHDFTVTLSECEAKRSIYGGYTVGRIEE